MGHITTTYDFPNGLTTFKVIGKVRASDFVNCLASYYNGSVTLLNLWDATEADLSAIVNDEMEAIAYFSSFLAVKRKGGKTAIVSDTQIDFSLARMFESLLETVGLPLETYVCRSLDEARNWLGVGGSTVAEINIDRDNKIIQSKLTGEINTDQAINLIHNISIAVKLNQDYDILVDNHKTTFKPGIVDLLEIASECSEKLIGFNRKIVFLIPKTEHRKHVAALFRSCMEIKGFNVNQFFDCDAAMEWLTEKDRSSRKPHPHPKHPIANALT